MDPNAEVAQLVELLLPKQMVVGSSPIFRSYGIHFGGCRFFLLEKFSGNRKNSRPVVQ